MKLGCLPYLNVKPLVYTLEHGGLPHGWELVYAPPAELARLLESGELAAAPVSSFATLTNPDFDICPGICISSDGPVQSVLMLSRVQPGEVRTVALDTSSLSGASMLKIILAELYGCHPQFVPAAPGPVSGMLAEADAALLIGDPAMTCEKDGLQVLDLGEAWKRLTGLPAVFALWAGPGITPEVVRVLQAAREAGLRNLEAIALSASGRLGVSYNDCYDYLSKTIAYDFGERERQGLEEFRRRSVEHGLLSERVGAL